MKKFIIFFLLMLPTLRLNAQNKFAGYYEDYFGHSIKINDDSTFQYRWNFDLASSWSNGTWKVIDQTIYFTFVPVFDTLTYKDEKRNIIIDTLVLAMSKKPRKITVEDFRIEEICSGGQNRVNLPQKLCYKKGKLMGFTKQERLNRKRIRGFGTFKKYPTWYKRVT